MGLTALSLVVTACGSPHSAEPEARDRANVIEAQEMRERMSPVAEGLSAAHREALPVLERETCIPAIERGEPPTCHHDRVYADGAHYLLTTDRWLSVNPIPPEHMAELAAIYGAACDAVDPVRGDDDGSVIHLVHMESCRARIPVTGIPEGPLEGLNRATDILNQ